MKVRVTFIADEAFRRALAKHFGEKGLATRKTIATWMEMALTGNAEDILSDGEEEDGLGLARVTAK